MRTQYMILKHLAKFNFLATLAMFFFVAMMVVEQSMEIRAFLLLPIVFFWYVAKILYTLDRLEKK